MQPRLGIITSVLALALASSGLPSVEAVAGPPASEPLRFDAAPLVFPADPLSFPDEPIERETADTIEITLPADILFDFDMATLRPAAAKVLREVADIIRQKSGRPVAVQGYTDALGKDAYNQKLSERRADAVKAWLVTKESLAAIRFGRVGFGARNPVAPNRKPDGSDDPDGRQLNRRVTIIIQKH